MPANVETMFSVRETPWHGLGRIIMDAPASREDNNNIKTICIHQFNSIARFLG